jgi:hypothetical protein
MRGCHIGAVQHRYRDIDGRILGFQLRVTYRHPTDRQQSFATAMHGGVYLITPHPRYDLLVLEEGERIQQVTVSCTFKVQRLLLETSLGRQCEIATQRWSHCKERCLIRLPTSRSARCWPST